MKPEILEQIFNHAYEQSPAESCGLLVTKHRKMSYVLCRNIAQTNEQFVIHPDDLANAEAQGDIVAIVHSHPSTPPEPSQADLIGIERTQLPWIIVNPHTRTYTETFPTGYVAPLVGREFLHGVSDCYSLVQDYYKQKLGIVLPDIEREVNWWLKGNNLFKTKYESCGFVEVRSDQMQLHDWLVMQISSPVENHGAIYIGQNQILHHLSAKLSSRDVYGGYWRKCTTRVLRHRELA